MGELEKILLSWDDFGKLSKNFSHALKSQYKGNIDVVIGIAKGGLPPSLQIANELGAKWDSMRVSSYIADGIRGDMTLVHDIHTDISGKTIMIVDDIVDEGNTMRFVKDYLSKKYSPKMIITTALILKRGSHFKPDNYAREADKWILFPWEAPCE